MDRQRGCAGHGRPARLRRPARRLGVRLGGGPAAPRRGARRPVPATHADGVPRITARYRGENPDKPPGNYGLVSLEVALAWPSEVTTSSRAVDQFDSGCWTALAGPASTGSARAQNPCPGTAPCRPPGAWVSPETITWLISAIATRAAQASADVVVRGIAPRLPVRVRLDWAKRPAAGRCAAPCWPWLDELATRPGPSRSRARPIRGCGWPRPCWNGCPPRVRNPGGRLHAACRSSPAHHQRHRHLVLSRPVAGPIDLSCNVPAGVVNPALDLGWVDIDVLAPTCSASRSACWACGVNLISRPEPARPGTRAPLYGGTDPTCWTTPRRHPLRLAPGEPPTTASSRGSSWPPTPVSSSAPALSDGHRPSADPQPHRLRGRRRRRQPPNALAGGGRGRGHPDRLRCLAAGHADPTTSPLVSSPSRCGTCPTRTNSGTRLISATG